LFFILLGASTMVRVIVGAMALLAGCYAVGKIILGAVVLIVEDKGAYESLRRSWALTAGHWWRVAAILTVLVIVIFVLFLVIGVIAVVVAASMGSTARVGGLLIQVISLLGNTLVAPLYAAVLLAIFYDLKLRKEGADLAGRVSALAV
jgi:p-aminobenzoyl-glutamate transporter AbgT